jgi:hypothetical protein
MPFEQCQTTEVFLVELEDGCQPWDLVEFQATAAVFPMADAFRFHAQLCRDRGLFQSQRYPALPEQLGHTSIIRLVHGF